jgi:hypothetical protein
MESDEQKRRLNKELDEFNFVLSQILPRYLELIKKENISPEEEKELSNTEHSLLEINTKVAEIKSMLDQDLFGETINLYYRVKGKAKTGDLNSKLHLDQLRIKFQTLMEGDYFFNWN